MKREAPNAPHVNAHLYRVGTNVETFVPGCFFAQYKYVVAFTSPHPRLFFYSALAAARCLPSYLLPTHPPPRLPFTYLSISLSLIYVILIPTPSLFFDQAAGSLPTQSQGPQWHRSNAHGIATGAARRHVHAAVHGTGWSGRQHVGPALLAWSPARSEGRRRGHRRERRGAVEAQPLCYCFLLFILVLFS